MSEPIMKERVRYEYWLSAFIVLTAVLLLTSADPPWSADKVFAPPAKHTAAAPNGGAQEDTQLNKPSPTEQREGE